MGNPMVQVEHCPEIDDARNFGVDVGNGQAKCGLIEVEFKDTWENAASLGLCITGHGIFHDGVIIPVDYGDI